MLLVSWLLSCGKIFKKKQRPTTKNGSWSNFAFIDVNNKRLLTTVSDPIGKKEQIKMVGETEAKRGSFYIVYIPSDDSKELEEWQVTLPKDKDAQIGCLTERLRQHFKTSASGTNNVQEQQDIFKKQLLEKLPAGSNMNDDMLNMMLQVKITHLLLSDSDVSAQSTQEVPACLNRWIAWWIPFR